MWLITRARMRKISRTSGCTARSAYRCRNRTSGSSRPPYTLVPSSVCCTFPRGSGRRLFASSVSESTRSVVSPVRVRKSRPLAPT